MKNLTKFTNIIIIILLFYAVTPMIVWGGANPQGDQNTGTRDGKDSYVLLAPLGGKASVDIGSDNEFGFADYLQKIIDITIGVAAIVSVIMLIIGGVEYIMSSVSEVAKKDAKDRITNAILGILIALSGYLILNTINPDLLKLGLPKIKELNPPTK